jgi:predicted O-linked N-acetylglucosamine transferase (SPINDLY family)
VDPQHPHALHGLGLIAQETGRTDTAVDLLTLAIAATGGDAPLHSNLGWALHAEGRLHEAVASFRAAVACAPRSADAHGNLGQALHAQGRLDEAVASFREALGIAPDGADIHNNLAVVLKDLGRVGDAIESYERALALEPGLVTAHVNLGLARQAEGRLVDAMGCFTRAIVLAPDAAEAYDHLVAVLVELGRVDEAVTIGRRAVAQQPNLASAHANLGLALHAQGRTAEAVVCYRRALGIAPRLAEAHHNLGTALEELGDVDSAVTCYEQAVALGLERAGVYANLGHMLIEQNRTDAAIAAYRRAHALAPDAAWEIAAATALPVITASTEAIAAARERLGRNLEALLQSDVRVAHPDRPTITPNFFLAYNGLDDRQLQETMALACVRANPTLAWTAPHCFAPPPVEGRRIRVGFVSAYLYEHSIGRLTHGLIEHLSRDRFEVAIFHARRSGDALSAAIDRSADRAIRLPNRLREARERIAAEALDVLVYPDIGMARMTYHLAFARLAPVQCVMWGHPDTTGLATVDYFISSAALEPAGADQHYTERLHRLSRLPTHYPRPSAAVAPLTRAALGLDEGATLYVCPQTLFKLHPDYDAILADILRRDRRGRLVLIDGQSSRWSRDWRERFAGAGADVIDRVVVLPRMAHADFLRLLVSADALLDPLVFSGGTTSYAALGLGAPIVTWPGQFMRGRVTYACYRQLGVMDCVVDSAEAYVETALRLANDPAWRAGVSARLVAGHAELFEDVAVVREIEEFFARAAAEATTSARRSVLSGAALSAAPA